MTSPLSGIKILDFTRAVSGAFGSMLLSDLGAVIYKIENVPETEPVITDVEEIEITESLAHFWGLNRGKKGICLDLKKPAARDIVYDLIRKCDAIYDNFRPGVLQRLGIDYSTIKNLNPQIISCSVTGYGDEGPLKFNPSYDVIAQALSGVMSITGEPGRMPGQCGMAIGDLAAGLLSAFGMVSALLGRERSGKGQKVETSILDTLLSFQSYRVPQVFGAGMHFEPHPRRSGAGQVPYGAFQAKDGRWITLAAGPSHFWEAMCKAIKREDLLTDPRFITLEKRQEFEDELSQILEQAFQTQDANEWVTLLSEVGVPVGKVNTIKEAFLEPQTEARKMLISFDHPLGKRMKCAGNPLKLSSIETQEYTPAPGIGEHTREVLSGLLNYPEDRIEKLKNEKAIWYPDKGVFYGMGLMARF